MRITLYHGTDCLFDVVMGPVANYQVTFHTQCAVEKLHLIRRYTVE